MNTHETPSTRPRHRRATIAVAGLVGAGLTVTGVVLADGANASGGPSNGSGTSSNSSGPAAPTPPGTSGNSSSNSSSSSRPTPPTPVPHIDGKITSVSGDQIVVTDPDGFSRTIVTSSSTVYRKDGKSASSSIVSDGVTIHATGRVDSNRTSLDASTVEVGMPQPPAGGPAGGPGGPGAGPAGKPGAGPAAKPGSSSGSSSSGSSGSTSGPAGGLPSGGPMNSKGSAPAPAAPTSSGSASSTHAQ